MTVKSSHIKKHLNKLQVLLSSDIQLPTLPDETGELKKLKVLLVAGNPVTLEGMVQVMQIQKISIHTYETEVLSPLSFLYGGPPPPQASHENNDAKENLRGPAPKKRPMISSSKIESADFDLPSRGYRILFKNEFLLFQFYFKPKISSRKLFPSDSSKIRPKISPHKNRFINHSRNAK